MLKMLKIDAAYSVLRTVVCAVTKFSQLYFPVANFVLSCTYVYVLLLKQTTNANLRQSSAK